MTPRKSKKHKVMQEPPIAFRPGPELAQLVTGFAHARQVGEAECYKNLAALAIVGLDVRHYDVVAALGVTQPGVHAFVRTVLHLRTSLQTAARLDSRYAYEPLRSQFLISTIHDQLKSLGRSLPLETARVLLQAIGVITNTIDEDPVDQTSTFQSMPNEEQRQKIPIFHGENT